MAGVVFRYHTNRHYYLFALDRAATRRAWPCACRSRRRSAWPTGASWATAAFPYDTTRYYRLKVENQGATIRAYVDGQLVLAADRELLRGKAGVAANIPARFQDFRVTRRRRDEARIDASDRPARRGAGRAPRPATRSRSSGRSSRPRSSAPAATSASATSTATARPTCSSPRTSRGSAATPSQISCLTAVTLDGKVLWQIGRPDPRNGLLTTTRRSRSTTSTATAGTRSSWSRTSSCRSSTARPAKSARRRRCRRALPDDRSDSPTTHRQRRLAHVRQLLRANPGAARSGQGPLRNFWVFDGDLKLLWKGEGQTRPLSLSVPTSTATAATSSPSATPCGTTPASSSGATTRS